MRSINITIDSKPVGQQRTWAYPNGQSLGQYLIPIYQCSVAGVDDAGRPVSEQFDALRFGVQSKDGRTARVVGLANRQTHIVKRWLPTYQVHSARSLENGAWQVYDSFLIHDGPDSPHELFATIGCIEIMGHRGFVRFNDLIISLAGSKAANRPEQLVEIGKGRKISIEYKAAARPALKKAP